MFVKKLFANLQLTVRPQSFIGRCCASKSATEILKSAQETAILPDEVPNFEYKRNKSRLNNHHRNMLFGQKPYSKSMMWYHDTVKYKKRLLGRYGIEAVGVPVGFAWPTVKEVEEIEEYERFMFPLTLEQRWQKIKEEHKKKEEAMIARDNKIHAKMANMSNLMHEIKEKIIKKKKAEKEAKLLKEKRIKEMKQKLGVTHLSMKGKAAEMMAQYEKAEKKKRKETKKQLILEKQKQFMQGKLNELNELTRQDKDKESMKDSPTAKEPEE